MRLFFTFLYLTSFIIKSFGQNLYVQHEGSNLYIYHIVAPKENWYSISRMYNASPKDLVTINQTGVEMGLAITQKIKIPLSTKNFIQSEKISTKDALVPLYHLILTKEGLYRISLFYNKVPISRIKEWNKLSSDDLRAGDSLIIGYLKKNKDTVSKANEIELNKIPDGQKVDSVANNKTVLIQSKPTEKPKQTNITSSKPVVASNKHEVSTSKTNANLEKPVLKVEVAKSEKVISSSNDYFLEPFNTQNKGKLQNNISGIADIFKSNSGWNDGKYYVLMNSITPGTIVKIEAASSNLAIYAKVLGSIPVGKENEGLTIRLSNAASAKLNAGEGRFDVKISW
jgi:hypothetical protein